MRCVWGYTVVPPYFPSPVISYIRRQLCNLNLSVKPQILTRDRKVRIRAGNTHTMDVDFIGSPEPTVTWLLNDAEVGFVAYLRT